jgi:tetratricopeptide (TPR) repeat protein
MGLLEWFGMFSRPKSTQLRRIEEAFEQGRLDEAYSVAQTAKRSTDSAVLEAVARLADALMVRGQEHLLARRFADALADFGRAGDCGHPLEKVAQWRKRAHEAAGHAQDLDRRKNVAVEEARNRLKDGDVAGAREARAAAPYHDTQVGEVSHAIHDQSGRSEQARDLAEQAWKDGRLAVAVEQVLLAGRLNANVAGLADLQRRIVETVLIEARRSFKEGNLSRAEHDMKSVKDIVRGNGEAQELERALETARQAARLVARADFSDALVLIDRLAAIEPQIVWIGQAREHLQAVEQQHRALLAGPLGWLASSQPTAAPTREAAPTLAGGRQVNRIETPAVDSVDSLALGRRLLLRIDGVGSFLLVRGDRVGIGRAGPDATADIPLISDLSERAAEIIRAGEDYFVMASGGVELAGRPVEYALLQDGDRVRVGRRVKLDFRRPSSKSTSAVLDFGEGVRMASDCRRVILWDGPVVMGAGKECHIRLPAGAASVVLIERGGRMFVKPAASASQIVPLPLGISVELGELRLSVAAWAGATATGRIVG